MKNCLFNGLSFNFNDHNKNSAQFIFVLPSRLLIKETKTLKKDWVLTADAFALLLTALNPDPEQAGIKYEQIRRKIIRKLEFEGSSEPEEHADEVFNRVARRVTEGEQLDAESPDDYFLQTAQFRLTAAS